MLPLLADVAQLPPAPHATATRVDRPPVIDGRLDDEAWSRAPPITSFTQKFPDEGLAPTEKTTLRILYDDAALYIGFVCEQPDVPVTAPLTRRDRPVETDWVAIDLGTRGDHKTAFEFQVSAAGVLSDSIRYDDTEISSDWDENWEAKTTRTASGWTAEMRIPLRILRFSAASVQTWSFQARRYVSPKQETDEWAYIPRSAGGEVSHYGTLEDLRGLSPPTPLELRPFVLGKLRRRDAGATGTGSGTDLGASAGLDAKLHPTRSLTLDLAVNPDFGQVEADQLVLNLTTYETFYPEKRPFFLEGIDTFTTPRQLVYTRRIGRAAPSPSLGTGEQLADLPQPATIYGASKLTGRLYDGWSIGTLQAVTAENHARVQLPDGSRVDRTIDPLTSFGVLRLKREIGPRAHVGTLFTAVTRGERGDPQPRPCPNGTTAAPSARCFDDAYAASTDWLWRSGNGDWVTGGQAIATTLPRGPERSVPDGTTIRNRDVGSGAFAYLAKEGGTHWVGDGAVEYEGRKLDYNDLGYNQRANDYRWRVDLEYRELQKWWTLLESHARLEYFGRTNLDGLDIGSGYQANVSGRFSNFWKFFVELHWRPRRFDDREVGDGTALERAGLGGLEVELYTDKRKPVSVALETQTQLLSNGFNFTGTARVLYRVLPPLDVELIEDVVDTFGEPRYVATPSPGLYVFGRLSAKSLGTTLRTTYTFTPNLTLQTYAQLFLASGHYSGFSQFAAPSPGAVVHLRDLVPFGGTLASNPDLQQGALDVNVVLRWEYRLGSTVYLVYTRSQSPTIVLAPGDEASLRILPVGRAPAADVFLLKLAYWWG